MSKNISKKKYKMVNLIFFFILTNIFFLILILLNPNNPNPTDDIRSRHSAVVIPVPVAVSVAVPVSVIPAFAIFTAAPVIPAAVNLDVIHAIVTIAALAQIAM